MSRFRRIIIPGIPHHITQRGVRKQRVFFEDLDYSVYLRLLEGYAKKYGVAVLAYCLMPNHVHLLLVPKDKHSIARVMQLTHKRYADYINERQGCTGHLWQQRFYSSPVDQENFWVTLRYIERNPCEAGMVTCAVDYAWSSACGHSKRSLDPLLTIDPEWVKIMEQKTDWAGWLEDKDEPQLLRTLELCTSRNLPWGSDTFLDKIERVYGAAVRIPKRGRPVKKR